MRPDAYIFILCMIKMEESCAHKWWNNLDNTIRDKIIESVYISHYIKLDTCNELKEYRVTLESETIKNIEEVKTMYELKIEELNKEYNKTKLEIEQLKIKYENEIKHRDNEISLFDKSKKLAEKDIEHKFKEKLLQLESKLEQKEQQIRERDFSIEKLKNQSFDEMEKYTRENFRETRDNINEVKTLVESLKRSTKTNVQLGLEGEQIVDEILYKNYSDILINDTSTKKGDGDRIVTINNTSVILEIKNVKQSSLINNINKYKKQIIEDLTNSSKSNNINVGILVSIDDTEFNGSQYMTYEIVNTDRGQIGIICCSSVSKYPFILLSSIRLAVVLSKILYETTRDDDDLLILLKTQLPIIQDLIMKLGKDFDKLEELQYSNKQSVFLLNKFIISVAKLIDYDYNNHQLRDNILLDDVKNVYLEMKENNNNITAFSLQKVCIEKGLPKSIIRTLGGFKRIKDLIDNEV